MSTATDTTPDIRNVIIIGLAPQGTPRPSTPPAPR